MVLRGFEKRRGFIQPRGSMGLTGAMRGVYGHSGGCSAISGGVERRRGGRGWFVFGGEISIQRNRVAKNFGK